MKNRVIFLASIGIAIGCNACSFDENSYGFTEPCEDCVVSEARLTGMPEESYKPDTCGNGQLDPGEVCDGALGLDAYSCKAIFGDGSTGIVTCADNCLSTIKSDCTPPYSCGNGSRGLNEKCEVANPWASKYDYAFQCSEYGASGYRYCTSKCRWDNSQCSAGTCVDPNEENCLKCGNGVIDSVEECDPNAPLPINPNTQKQITCEDKFGPGSVGVLGCTNLCTLSFANCTVPTTCGNNTVDKNEVCDGTNLNKKSCKTMGREYSGKLGCLPNCSGYDFSGCDDTTKPNYVCGNGILEPGEVCDGTAGLDKYSCKNYFGANSTGSLSCSSDCLKIKANGCSIVTGPRCGDGILQQGEGEKCDYAIEYTEEQLKCTGNYEGVRSCNTNCRWDTSQCKVKSSCGNGVIEEGEECEPDVPISLNCTDLHGPGSRGTVSCRKDCKYDLSKCSVATTCGDGIIQNGLNDTPNYGEICDGTNVRMANGKKKSCRMLYGLGWTGTVVCLPNCAGYDGSGCVPPADN